MGRAVSGALARGWRLNAAARLQAALYAPTSAQLVQLLPTVADVIHQRLETIAAAPVLADVDAALRELGGLTATLMKLRVALDREGPADSREPDADTAGRFGHER